jgi:hypothetical protein
VGRGGHRSVGRALCVCLGERYVLFSFFQVLSRVPRFLDPRAVPDTIIKK